MVTWNDLSNYTWNDIADMRITYDDMAKLSSDQIALIAIAKLKRFKELPDNLVIPNELKKDIAKVCEPVKLPVKWSKPLSEKVFDKFLDTITDPNKLIAFVILIEKILNLKK